MILNSYAVLSVFVALVRLGLGVAVVGLAASAWRRPSADRDALEDRSYLVFLLALTLVVLNLVSWPLLYLLLQSYVPQWAGVMCIYGVTRVGEGSVGPARFLPDLLLLLQISKPALVFAGGAWFVLYLLNRRTATGSLLGRLFVVLVPVGVLAVADAGLELAYIGIPKKEEHPTGGCCTALDDPGTRSPDRAQLEDDQRLQQHLLLLASNAAVVLALVVGARLPRLCSGLAGLLLVGLGGLALANARYYLVHVASPTLLGLPHHHCAYDLIPEAPEAVAAVALYLAGFFCLGWASLAWWLGRSPETEAFLPGLVTALLRFSLCGYLMSLAMLSLELALV